MEEQGYRLGTEIFAENEWVFDHSSPFGGHWPILASHCLCGRQIVGLVNSSSSRTSHDNA
jgi:hypothetical protein